MARPGPKPKPGARYASGNLKIPACYAGPPPAQIKRLIDDALRGAADPRYGSVIGRLRLEGTLTDKQLSVAETYGRLRGRFDKVMGMPRRSAASVFYESGLASHTARGLDEDAIAQLREEHGRLLIEVGPVRQVLDRVVLFDEAPLPGELPRLKAGLDALAAFFHVERA